jgi:hypothetical protein
MLPAGAARDGSRPARDRELTGEADRRRAVLAGDAGQVRDRLIEPAVRPVGPVAAFASASRARAGASFLSGSAAPASVVTEPG